MLFVQPPNIIVNSLVSRILPTKMYRCSFWMKHWGGKTAKRTKLFSWSWAVSVFKTAKLKKKDRKSTIKTALGYTDAKGVRRWKGTGALKSTQFLFSSGCR